MIFHDHGLRAKFPALTSASDSWDALLYQNAELTCALHGARLRARKARLEVPLIATGFLCVGTAIGVLIGRLAS
jgi:hypothetical protein